MSGKPESETDSKENPPRERTTAQKKQYLEVVADTEEYAGWASACNVWQQNFCTLGMTARTTMQISAYCMATEAKGWRYSLQSLKLPCQSQDIGPWLHPVSYTSAQIPGCSQCTSWEMALSSQRYQRPWDPDPCNWQRRWLIAAASSTITWQAKRSNLPLLKSSSEVFEEILIEDLQLRQVLEDLTHDGLRHNWGTHFGTVSFNGPTEVLGDGKRRNFNILRGFYAGKKGGEKGLTLLSILRTLTKVCSEETISAAM